MGKPMTPPAPDKVYIFEGRWVLSYDQYTYADRMMTMVRERDRRPFVMGFEGEEWNDELPALFIPLPGTDRCILVVRNHEDGFSVITQDHWEGIGSMLMAAAYIRNFIDNYVTTGGNHGEAQTGTKA